MSKKIIVSKKPFSKYKTITEAIQKAVPGTKIFIEPGIYKENIVIDKQVELLGKGPVNEIVVRSENSTSILMQTERATVRGITIHQRGEAKGDEYFVAVDVPMGSLTLEDCHIRSDIGHGVRIYHLHTNPVIQRCNIHHAKGVGILIYSEGNPVIKDCKIYNSEHNGVWVREKGRGTIENCEIYGNKFPNITITSEGNPVIKGCKIYNSEQNGVWVYDQGRGTIEDCEIYSNKYPNIGITREGNPVIKGCKIYNCEQNGIWVKEKGRGTIDNCEIYGSKYPNIAIASEGNPVITGCKIYKSEQNGVWVHKKGRGTIEKCEIFGNRQPNIHIESEGNPVIKGCKIYKSEQNGVWVHENGFGTIENCQIYRNGYPNIAIKSEGNPVIKGCKIHNSEQNGVWVYDQGRGTIEDCEIYSNKYPNIAITGEGNPVFRDCKIYNNSHYGVWVKDKGRGTVESCEIYSNNVANIMIESEGNPVIRGCEIRNSEQNGVWALNKGHGTIENCKIYGNSNRDILISEDSHTKVLNEAGPREEKSEKAKPDRSSQASSELTEVLAELDSLIGMENVKEQIRKTIEYIQFNQELAKFGIESENLKLAVSHTVLYGNPGTGKTTLAKLLGKLYRAMGLLSSGHVVQVNREKLVAEYIGQTAPKTKAKIDEAIGGVLFIDEAYELTNKGLKNDFGPEAIAVLLEEMENKKGEFMVVVAGYTQEMARFLEANPGLKSRFTQYFHLQDYTPKEMVEIARKMVRDQKRQLSQDAEEALAEEFTRLWRKRDRFFANARTVRTYVEAMLQAQAQRCLRVPREQWTKEFLLTLTSEDVKATIPKEKTKAFDLPINEALLSEALQQLHRMIGMKRVKEEIAKLVTLVRFYKEEGRSLDELSPHTLLIGSPGTGKTEVARILARIYEALGILERGDLVEVNRDQLVSAYQGESEKLIAVYIDQAMGGTLLIDEVYQLTQYGLQDPGHKVIEVLLKRMEDDRGKFIVIATGYKEKIEQFLDSNDGLRRRFVRRIEFEDYTHAELMQISDLMFQEKGYQLDPKACLLITNTCVNIGIIHLVMPGLPGIS
ncbi:right-handed parallel beta-helix repeat-containing protein [Lihuaxuella thermophila]|uniref:F-box protein 11 n=1 Tax=Lihuaxuella thermophila TaxID=1173111 RepID=A0A1H8BRZ7_9BACL|nr:right-handed parallel beta-helix repeat-containing protein [Lihuaxuella thermophila]SEM85546.1 F-box protein 11 [Lihuaxuella thermophila]